MRRPRALQAPAWELAGLAILILAYLWGAGSMDASFTRVLNMLGPMVLLGLLGLSALRMIMLQANAIWTALFWFRTAAAVFYGVGNLIPVMSDEKVNAMLQGFYPFNSDDLANFNLMVAVSCFTVLASARFIQFTLAPGTSDGPPRTTDPTREKRRLLFVGLAFLMIGVPCKYFFLILGYYQLIDFVLPQSIAELANFTYAGVYLLTVWCLRYRISALPFMIAFVSADIFLDLLELQKFEPLMAFLLFALAFLDRRVTFSRIAAIAIAFGLLYATIAPIVTLGRAEFIARYGLSAAVGFGGRIDVILSSAETTNTAARSQTQDLRNVGLARLSYVNQANFAIHRYDFGMPGHSLSNALAVFVPRLLWPDKPVITQTSVDFNVAATGNPHSSSSPGLFADAYWNFGWTGVVLSMALLGALLAILSQFATSALSQGQWAYFPIVLLAMKLGLGVAGYILDIIGGSVILFAIWLVLNIVLSIPYADLLGLGKPDPAELLSAS